MKTSGTILQIVPPGAGARGGVAGYATNLAKKLGEAYGYETVFASGNSAAPACDHVILHYVNYGFQKRGVPMKLLSILRGLRRTGGGKLIAIFHELYASGRPWQSAYWLRPWQIHIARSIARLSDICIVSHEVALAQLRSLVPNVRVSVQPVFSNFGEPALTADQIADRDPHRWVIGGGTASIEQSLRSFRGQHHRIPENFSARELCVLGGTDAASIRQLIVDLADVRVDYRPQIDAATASQLLSTCSFAWLDYFHRPDVPTSVVLKSSAFAAYCAHGIVPIFPHSGSPISLEDDRLPGPFFIEANACRIPTLADRAQTARAHYDWYQRHASSEHLARTIAGALSA